MNPRSNNTEFLLKGHKVIIKERNSSFIPVLAFENESEWIETVQIPIFALDDEKIFFTDKIISSSSSKNGYKVTLQNNSHTDFSMNLEIIGNLSFYPWINIKIKIIFNKGRDFVSKVPEIRLIPFPSLIGTVDYVTIAQPTKHTPVTEEWKSNDMPAAYLWNPGSKSDLCFFMNFSEMNWMGINFFERFSLYECAFHPDNSFGLLQRIPLENPIYVEAGFEMIFDFYLAQGYREKKPTKYEAVEKLVVKSAKLIPSRVEFPKDGLSWNEFSKECINDLLKENFCFFNTEYPKYFAYVMDSAEIKRKSSIGKKRVFETMTLLDIIPPWILHLQIYPNEIQEEHVKRVYEVLHDFIDPKTNFFHNNIEILDSNESVILKPNKYSIGDSWYFFEPILRLGWLIRLTPLLNKDQKLMTSFEIMVKNSIKFIRNHNYEVNAFYDPFTLKPLHDCNHQRKELLIQSRGLNDIKWKLIAKNYACLGIHIYIMIEAFYFQDNKNYLNEAVIAADKFMEFSPDELFWEPLELAYAAAAFSELSRIKKDQKYLLFARQIILNELRMFYWYEDNSFNWKGKRSNLGLVMACVGIRYPAMKENIESIYPWLIFLKIAIQTDNLIIIPREIFKFFNLIRINSFYYFSNVLQEEFIYPPRRNSPCQFIPFEDLEMLETPPHFSQSQKISPKGSRTGTLGREIYGAGEVLMLALMFEALAQCENQDIMVLNLDLFDFSNMDIFPPKKQMFIVYNPLDEDVVTKLRFSSFQDKKRLVNIKEFNNHEISNIHLSRFSCELDISLKSHEINIIELSA